MAVEDERRVRCLKIVEHVYWSGSASSEQLSTTLAGLPDTRDTSASRVEQDIAVLRHDGLPMRVDEAGYWRIDAVIPGFAIRLTKAEASVVWAWLVAHGNSHRVAARSVSREDLSAAVATLLSGLRQFHKGSEVMNAAGDTAARRDVSRTGESKGRLQVSRLIGEARLVHRRLRVLDLIAGRRALNTSELATGLDVSRRTVHDDLNVLRRCGFEVKFSRRHQEFQIQGLNSYLADHLSLPMAAALLALFEPPDAPHLPSSGAVPWDMVSEKVARGIRLSFSRRAPSLQDLIASCQACGRAS